MKIIHCSDLHLDSKMANLSKEKALQRKRELILTFEKMVEFAKSNKVDAIIIAGDMFDSKYVLAKTRERVHSLISANPAIDFFYLAGNHDEENIIENFSDCQNLKIFGSDWTYFECGGVTICGRKLSQNNARIFDTLKLDSQNFNIVVLHGQLSLTGKSDENISLKLLKDKNIDYLALGHIHKFEEGKIDERGMFCYCGCLEGRGFDECGEKGFVLLEIQGEKIDRTFVPFARRTFEEVQFDISECRDWYEVEKGVESALKDKKSENLVKLILTGKYDLQLVKQIEELETKLNERFFFIKIYDLTSLKINIDDFKFDPSLKGEFIRLVLNSDLSEQEKEGTILTGLKALDGEKLL